MREMRDSGIKWLGEIPAEWQISRLGALFATRNCKVSDEDYAPLSVTMSGVVPQLSHVAKSDHHANRKLVRKGDFVINSRSDRHNSCGFAPKDGSVSLINTVCIPRIELNSRYFGFLFDSEQWADEFYSWGHGIVADLWATGWNEMKGILLPVPSVGEQRRIANYLDEKCAQIDRAIEAAEGSIEEMLKYRSSCLEETFNRLDGTYPKVKLKYVLEESKEKSVDGIGEPLSITIASGVLRSSELEIPNPASSMVGAKVVRAGDLVFNKLKAYFGVMYVSPYDGLISSEYAIYRALNPDALSLKYIEYLVHTNQIIDEFIIRISGVADGFRRLYTSDLFNISITLPPLRVQERAVRELNSLYDSVDASIAVKKSIIADLKAYKQSLIYEVVTGKREV